MDEKNRLIELLSDVDMVKLGFDGVHYVEIDYDRAAEYLLANGVIVLPCKIGDMVWAIRDYKGIKQPQEGIVSDMYFTKDMSLHIVVKYVARGEFGKTVFLTREEAEEKLREKSNG